ncbi:cation:proton antiporter regulatory subunit [Caloramator sp. E03]|uniref:cation:proton antiporter regulatory subunit n=1 Tax=Caloramator sp. E03 TaxID=2576307 RepID=UPI00143CF10C|nr:TrkA C-terminal domain-containing protein [Caloramator sp. E03]
MEKLIDYIERFKNISPFTLIEISIKEPSWVIGKNLDEVKFWKNTGATIIAYREGEKIVVSPGPDYRFKAGDIIVVIGSSDVYERVCNFIYGENGVD